MYLHGYYLIVFSFLLAPCLGFSIEQNEGNETSTRTVPQGILITGSYYDLDNLAEIYVPELKKTCSLPNTKTSLQRFGHTQNEFLSCGGTSYNWTDGEYWTYETCEVYVPGVGWSMEPYILNSWKTDHTSWTLKNGSVLLLGSILDDNETELVTPGVGTTPGFDFQLYPYSHSCGIPDTRNEYFYINGGNVTGNIDDMLNKVAKFGPNGFIEFLPNLKTGRMTHACAGYYDAQDHFVLLVAGGYGIVDYDYSSTEIFETGVSSQWREVSPLPHRLVDAKAVTLNNKVYLTGGMFYGIMNEVVSDEIFLFDDESWSLVSHMKEGRSSHAVSVISFDQDVENDCKETTSPSKASTLVISCNILLLAISIFI